MGGCTSQGAEAPDDKFFAKYVTGDTIGQGRYSTVASCTVRKDPHKVERDQRSFAVKMIEKSTTPPAMIANEAQIMQKLDHRCVVRLHEVIIGKLFAWIVMDLYEGGNLVDGFQRHLLERGRIKPMQLMQVSYQMGASIQYLHSKRYIHRAVKASNFVIDRKDLTHPACRVALIDFGTACSATPDQRFREQVGTVACMSPECFDGNYGMKVDVWSLGVIMYGLVTTRFPFKDEGEVRTKEVHLPESVHPECADFIMRALSKKEAGRPNSDQVMELSWFTDVREGDGMMTGVPTDNSDDDINKRNLLLLREALNKANQERRQTLRDRVEFHYESQQQLRAQKSPLTSNLKSISTDGSLAGFIPRFMPVDFTITRKDGVLVTYEWWSPERVKQESIAEEEGRVAKKLENACDPSMLAMMLELYNVDTQLFGVDGAKSLDQFVEEVERGSARLMIDAARYKQLVRVVDIVLLRLSTPGGSWFLIEVEPSQESSKFKGGRLPGSKKKPHENTQRVANRIVASDLRIPAEAIRLDFDSVTRCEEEEDSRSYPGVRTMYRVEIVDAILVKSISAPSVSKSKTLGSLKARPGTPMPEGAVPGNPGNGNRFKWVSRKQATTRGVKHLLGSTGAVSTLALPPIGLEETALAERLTQFGIGVDKFGKGKAKTLREFSEELNSGKASLRQSADGRVLRVVEVVALIIERHNGDLLVETGETFPDGRLEKRNRFPGTKRRPDENFFYSARRLIRKDLLADENAMELSTDVQTIEWEKSSPSYPGLMTMYRKYKMTAKFSTGELVCEV